MADLATAKQSLMRGQQQLQKRQTEAADIRRQLESAQQRLPEITQKTLRQSQNGLVGREQRRGIESARESLYERLGLVSGYEGELKSYESELGVSAREIAQVEQQVASIEAERAAFENAKRLYERKVSPYWIDDPSTKKYLESFWKQGRLARESFNIQIQQFISF